MSNEPIYRKDYKPHPFSVKEVFLDIQLDRKKSIILSKLTIERHSKSDDKKALLSLEGEGFLFKTASLNGKMLEENQDFKRDATGFSLLNSPEGRFELQFETEVCPEDNKALKGIFCSDDVLCTQCEATGFRHITYMIDRPDNLALFKTRLSGDKQQYPVLLANGNLTDSGEIGKRHWTLWEDPFLKPSYLFALVGGQLASIEDHFITMSGRKVRLVLYVEHGFEDRGKHAMDSLKASMKWDEETFGREYDLDIFMTVAVSDFNFGAMENKGLNIFNSKYILANPSTATDADYEAIEGVVGHEYFHNWSGNRVTCQDWFQLSLKEGFTVFRDQEFSSDMNDRTVKRIEDVRRLRAGQFVEDSGPLAHPVRPESYLRIDNFYTSTIYEKGAELVRMIKTIIGAQNFRKGSDLYFKRHDGSAATCEDFVKAMEDASSIDLTQFRLWYSQAGTPSVTMKDSYDEKTKQYRLSFTQHCPDTPNQREKKPMHIPVRIGLFSRRTGDRISFIYKGESVTETVLSLNDESANFTFDHVEEKPLPSVFRGFSAPIILENNCVDDLDLLLQAANDDDAFNCFDALQTYYYRWIKKSLAGKEESLDPLIETLSSLLEKGHVESPALVVQLLSIPSLSAFAEKLGYGDLDKLHARREFLQNAIANALSKKMTDIFMLLKVSNHNKMDSQSRAKRSLKAILMHYLTLLNDKHIFAYCLELLKTSQNMTNQMAALTFLAHQEGTLHDEAMLIFFKRWKNEPLIINKWFAAQALSKRADVLDHVKKLLTHSLFDIKNPNKVYALIHSFCSGNLIAFHKASGEGYDFLKDQILVIDSYNPQLAARILSPLTRWKKLDKERASKMKIALETIKNHKGLSKNTFELANKALA